MRKQDIEVIISPEGEVTITVKGIKGGGCLEESKFLEEALGGPSELRDQQRTAEFYEGGSLVEKWAAQVDDD